MLLCKSLLCLIGTCHLQHKAGTKIINGTFRNYLSLSNRESLLRSFTIRSIKTGRNATKPGINKGFAPKNIGVTFDKMGGNQIKMSILWKPLIFTVSFSAGSLAFCAIWQYENLRKAVNTHLKKVNLWEKFGIYGKTNDVKRFQWRSKLNKIWNSLTEAEKLFFTIGLANILVNLAWKVPKLETTMIKYFSSNPISSAICWPLLLSTFSHRSMIHLAFNMYALVGFTKVAMHSLGKEQFLGFYLAGGVIASFTSLLFKVVTNRPVPSVGASGAILAVVAYVCAKHPDLSISLIVLPMYPITAWNTIKVLFVIDLLGIIFRWKYLDHAAHLGGVCFGMFWYYWGNANIWQKRQPLLHWWHDLRNSMN